MSSMTTSDQIMYNLGPLDRLPEGEGRTFLLGDASIAVFRTRHNEIFATQASCPHKGGPLADGLIGDGKVICPLHAFKFHLATGATLGGTCEGLKTYTAILSEQGEILISLTE